MKSWEKNSPCSFWPRNLQAFHNKPLVSTVKKRGSNSKHWNYTCKMVFSIPRIVSPCINALWWQFYLCKQGSPQSWEAVWRRGALSSVFTGSWALPFVGPQRGVSLRRYSAWTGLWHCSTRIASSILNHFRFRPAKRVIFLIASCITENQYKTFALTIVHFEK